jgi:polyketide synthase PksN
MTGRNLKSIWFSSADIRELMAEMFENRMECVKCISIDFRQDDMSKCFENAAVQVFKEIRDTLERKHKGKVLIQALVPLEGEQQLFNGISGLFRTAQLENNKLVCQLIQADCIDKTENAVEILKLNRKDKEHVQIRHQSGKRYVMKLKEIKSSDGKWVSPWKDNGIYLITGGVGGLGTIFAREIAEKVKGVTLILTGRSPLNADKEEQIKALEESGAKVSYIQADISDKKAASALIRRIHKGMGKLDGIIHSAGINMDNFIIKKTEDEFLRVLAPKVTGLVNLDKATMDMKLDFFILFSALAGSMGNAGQSDYCTANAFMDVYAAYRNSQVASGQRHGRTMSVCWPLWADGGMHVDRETENLMHDKAGLVPMKTDKGIQALYQSWAIGRDQVIVMEGVAQDIRAYVTGIRPETPTAVKETNMAVDSGVLFDRTIRQLKTVFSEISGMSIDRIDSESPLKAMVLIQS